jgi:hypothetical protein
LNTTRLRTGLIEQADGVGQYLEVILLDFGVYRLKLRPFLCGEPEEEVGHKQILLPLHKIFGVYRLVDGVIPPSTAGTRADRTHSRSWINARRIKVFTVPIGVSNRWAISD